MSREIPLKKAGDFSLPVLGLGTWQMGGHDEKEPAHDAQDLAGINNAIQHGITHIDTAEVYAAGHAEELIGEVIKNFDRTKLLITSKVSGTHLNYDEVIKAAKASLARLGIRTLHLYLVHWPNPEYPLKETMRAMDFLLENGLIKNAGVSNFLPEQIAEAQSYIKYRIVNNQINYSVAARGHETAGTLDYCRKKQILVTAYRPLLRGSELLAENSLLSVLAKKYEKSPRSIALNWVINKPNIVALVKTSNPKHLEENLTALGWRLDPADELEIDKNFPRGETMGLGQDAKIRVPPSSGF